MGIWDWKRELHLATLRHSLEPQRQCIKQFQAQQGFWTLWKLSVQMLQQSSEQPVLEMANNRKFRGINYGKAINNPSHLSISCMQVSNFAISDFHQLFCNVIQIGVETEREQTLFRLHPSPSTRAWYPNAQNWSTRFTMPWYNVKITLLPQMNSYGSLSLGVKLPENYAIASKF